jgi:hypothetical protein
VYAFACLFVLAGSPESERLSFSLSILFRRCTLLETEKTDKAESRNECNSDQGEEPETKAELWKRGDGIFLLLAKRGSHSYYRHLDT